MLRILNVIQFSPKRYSYNFATPMRYMVWIIILQLLANTLNAQYNNYPKLVKLFDAEKYDKCIKKAEKYADKDRKELIPQVYLMKCWLKIADDPEHEYQRRAIGKAISAARRIKRKDKDMVLFDRFMDDFVTLQLKAFAKADADMEEGRCSHAIRVYDDINEIFDDATSAYKKSLCLLTSDFKKKEGFILLRNTMLRLYSNYKKNKAHAKLPQGFARLSKEYLDRRYFYNAEDVLRKGIEVFPNDTSIRSETVRQVVLKYDANITSDYQKDLLELRDRLLWADSSFNDYPAIIAMLKETDKHIIEQYIKYDYDKPQKAVDFINQCKKHSPKQYTNDSINNYLASLYNDNSIRRIEGALPNLTKVIIAINKAPADGANKPTAQYVFDYILNQGNYEIAAYFIKQAQQLYPQDKKMLAAMQQSLESLLVELLTDVEKDEISLDLAEKFSSIAPDNKKLKQLEYGLYTNMLKQYAADSNFSAFTTISIRGLSRFPKDIEMLKMKKEMVIKDFNQNFAPNLIEDAKEMKVVYHIATCTPGKVAPEANKKFIGLLNYLRRQAGVYDSCFLDDELNEWSQQAALMMTAANELSHSPDSTWKCFTRYGKKAAGSSNLSLGYGGTKALLGQMEDNGAGNGAVGHRRWVLNPFNKVFGHGSTDKSMSLYVFGKRFDDPIKNERPEWDSKQFISWPPKDFAPKTLVPERWSFSLENADFGKAQISVTKKGRRVKIKPEKVSNGYGLNTCVWKMPDDVQAGDVYTITIKNIGILAESKPKSFTYTIEILDL